MATIQSVAELAYRQVFPNPQVTNDITIEEFIESAKLLYTRHLWDINRINRQDEGFTSTNPNLLSFGTITIENNKADLAHLNAIDYFNGVAWIQQIGDIMEGCEACGYTLYDLPKYKALCNDDSVDKRKKPAVLVGKQMMFPKGSWKDSEPIIYVGSGDGLDDEVEVDNLAASFVRQSLVELYLGKKGPEDTTNNNNSNV